MNTVVLIVIGLSSLIPLLPLFSAKPDPTLLLYDVFLLSLRTKLRLSHRAFFPLLLLCGLLTEILAWTGNFLSQNPHPPLLHPQLLPDLLLACGFYGSWALSWIVLRKWFTFSVWEVFMIQGVYGICFEQSGAIFRTGLTTFPFGLLLWLYVFLVYGSITGTAFALTPLLTKRPHKSWYKYIVAVCLLIISTALIFGLWYTLLTPILPMPKSIVRYPLW